MGLAFADSVLFERFEDEPVRMLLCTLAVACFGIVVGATSVGGVAGLLMVTLLGGVDVDDAVPAAIFSYVFTTSFAFLLNYRTQRRLNTAPPLTKLHYLIATAVPFGVLGAIVSIIVDPGVLGAFISAVIVAVGLNVLHGVYAEWRDGPSLDGCDGGRGGGGKHPSVLYRMEVVSGIMAGAHRSSLDSVELLDLDGDAALTDDTGAVKKTNDSRPPTWRRHGSAIDCAHWRCCGWKLLLIGALVGFGAPVTGSGGGLLLMPIFLTLRMNPREATLLTLSAQVPITFIVSCTHAIAGSIDVVLGLYMAVLMSAGSAVGVHYVYKMDMMKVKALLGVLLTVLGLYGAVKYAFIGQ